MSSLPKKSGMLRIQSYWESQEAKSSFWPSSKHVLEVLDRRITKLQKVMTTCDGYERLLEEVQHNENDDGEDISEKISRTTINLMYEERHFIY